METKEQLIFDYVNEIRLCLDILPVERLIEAVDVIKAARKDGRTVFTIGNGGSSATASHMACDFSKNTRDCTLAPIRCICLNDSMPIFSAFGNDEGYETVFAEPLKTLAKKGDVLIAISGSGNSPNILRALETAHKIGLICIGLSGFKGGKMIDLVDVAVNIDTDSIERVEDIHMLCDHLMTMTLRETRHD